MPARQALLRPATAISQATAPSHGTRVIWPRRFHPQFHPRVYANTFARYSLVAKRPSSALARQSLIATATDLNEFVRAATEAQQRSHLATASHQSCQARQTVGSRCVG